MSLDETQKARTGAELRRHLHASGLGMGSLAEWLRLPVSVVTHVLAMDDQAQPTEVWLVRDALDAVVREKGADAGGWTDLTDEARREIRSQVHLRPLPPRPETS